MIRVKSVAVVVFAASLSWTGPVSAQVFFNTDYSAAAAPAAGWPNGAVPTTATHDRVRVAEAGPQGEDVYELNQRHTGSAASGFGGEFYWGWNGNIEPSDPPQGARRFYRWRMRFSPQTNFRGLQWQDGSPTTLTNKILMVGDGCGRNNCRVIVSYRGTGGQTASLTVAIDGGASPTPGVILPVGQWLDVQVEADSATTTSSRDGAFKLWINSNDYARPTAQITGIQLNPVNWRYVFFGAYNNNGLASNGVHSFRQAGFQASTTFDANWSRAATLPSTPNNLRIIPPY
ncbi:hypothetical protein [Luteitalea sp.]|uniref:hypothetical protein n=1 Tax=Luteitalea sp. TaxID=2004800 RepID=UPI0025B7DF15|nr:hypothetical protein [Luteitalea sp.]